MSDELKAYISIYNFWNNKLHFSLSQWLEARDAFRNDIKIKKIQSEILSSKDKLEKIKNKYF